MFTSHSRASHFGRYLLAAIFVLLIIGSQWVDVKGLLGNIFQSRPSVTGVVVRQDTFTQGPPAPNSLGPALTDPRIIAIASLDIQNDTAVDRPNEVAWSSIALPDSGPKATVNVNELFLVGPGNQRLQAQFNVVSRWAGPVSDTTRPIRWLAIAVQANVPASSTVYYSLQKNPGADTRAIDPTNDLQVTSSAASTQINSGTTQFSLNPTLPGIIETIDYNGIAIYNNTAAAGPYLIDEQNQRWSGVPDVDGFYLDANRSGPVRTVVRSRGHFIGTVTPCNEPIAYTMWLSFHRGSPNMDLEFEVINECGNGLSGPYLQRYVAREVGWEFPFAMNPATRKLFMLNDTANDLNFSDSPAGYNGPGGMIEQERGSIQNANWRLARASVGQNNETADFYEKPLVAIGDENVTATLHKGWMRFQEPTALAVEPGKLTIKFFSSDEGIGEAQTRWHMGQLRLLPGNAQEAMLRQEANLAQVEVERRLLVHAPVQLINTTGIYPGFPEGQGPIVTQYKTLIDGIHSDMVGPNGQVEQMKAYGVIWPETYGRDRDLASPGLRPDDHPADGSNYWSGTNSELMEFLRTGEPRFYWDWAFPMEQRLLKTAVYSTGTRETGFNQECFSVGTGPATSVLGMRDRNNAFGSDDYLYVMGSDEFYVLNPRESIEQRFNCAGQSAINRYSLALGQTRDPFVSERNLVRQTTQHWLMLQYCSEFAQDPTLSSNCYQLLDDIVRELARDNFFAGIACVAESGNGAGCDSDSMFMYSALEENFIRRYLTNWGDVATGALRRTLITMGGQFYRQMMGVQSAGGSIDLAQRWATWLNCSFDAGGGITNCSGITAPPTSDQTWEQTYASHISTLMIADSIANSGLNLCQIGAQALNQALSSGVHTNWFGRNANGVGGWWKGASQTMQNIIFGAGWAETCEAGLTLTTDVGTSTLGAPTGGTGTEGGTGTTVTPTAPPLPPSIPVTSLPAPVDGSIILDIIQTQQPDGSIRLGLNDRWSGPRYSEYCVPPNIFEEHFYVSQSGQDQFTEGGATLVSDICNARENREYQMVLNPAVAYDIAVCVTDLATSEQACSPPILSNNAIPVAGTTTTPPPVAGGTAPDTGGVTPTPTATSTDTTATGTDTGPPTGDISPTPVDTTPVVPPTPESTPAPTAPVGSETTAPAPSAPEAAPTPAPAPSSAPVDTSASGVPTSTPTSSSSLPGAIETNLAFTAMVVEQDGTGPAIIGFNLNDSWTQTTQRCQPAGGFEEKIYRSVTGLQQWIEFPSRLAWHTCHARDHRNYVVRTSDAGNYDYTICVTNLSNSNVACSNPVTVDILNPPVRHTTGGTTAPAAGGGSSSPDTGHGEAVVTVDTTAGGTTGTTAPANNTSGTPNITTATSSLPASTSDQIVLSVIEIHGNLMALALNDYWSNPPEYCVTDTGAYTETFLLSPVNADQFTPATGNLTLDICNARQGRQYVIRNNPSGMFDVSVCVTKTATNERACSVPLTVTIP